jgi:hypothetical protein
MGTLIQKEQETINFLDFTKKTGDWRHRAYEKLFFDNVQEKTIHWIGTIPLSEVEEEENSHPVCFYTGIKLLEDYATKRDVDGAALGRAQVLLFNIPKILKQEMLEAKKKGEQFYSFFIEETVNSRGLHRVYALYTEQTESNPVFGISSQCPWYDLSYSKLKTYINFCFHDHIKRDLILSQKSYNWLK